MDVGEHTSELGRWRTVQRPADPRLRAYVNGYFASSSNLERPVRERHVPSTEVPLLLNFGAPHRRLNTEDDGAWTALDDVWVVGLHKTHQRTEAVGERHFMVVRFTPMGAHLFIGLPMHLITDQAVDLASIDPVLARVVMSRVGSLRSWDDRFAAMESLIAERVFEAQLPASVGPVWRRLVAANGRVPLSALAAKMDCSHRTLIADFRACVGFPPKTIARLLRFNLAIRALDRLSPGRADESASKPYIEGEGFEGRLTGAAPWADIAAECGYFDQAHLIKEFRAFAGSTPAAFLRQVSDRN